MSTVNREELIAGLNAVQPGLASKEIIEQSQSFAFQGGQILTYNDTISIRYPFDCGIEGAVKAEELHQLLTRMTEKEISLEAREGELLVQGRRLHSGIRLEAEISLPMQQIKLPKEWLDLPERFLTALKFCLFSASSDMTRKILTCLHISGGDVESSDNFRMTRHTIGSGSFSEPLLLQASSVAELLKYSPTKYGIRKGWAHFKTKDGVVFSCRTFDGKFPKVDRLLDVQGTKVILPVEKLKNAIERAQIFARAEFDRDTMIEINLKEGRLLVRGQGEVGWSKEKIRVDYSGKPISFSIHPQFLLDVLNLLDEVTIGESSLKMTGKHFVHVASLMVPTKKEE